ncbi:MAG: ubiquitin-like domain-containing protein [Candidatus Saccharibacteria bacterium]
MFIMLVSNWANNQITVPTDQKAFADGQNLVSVYYDGNKKTVATNANTVGEALQKMGVTLNKGDVVEPAADQPLSEAVTNINVYRAYPYVIYDGNKKIQTLSGYRSPRKIIEQAGITVYPEDDITTDRIDQFESAGSVGESIHIDRAMPVTVVLAGKTFEFRTHKGTVAELFTEKGLEIKPSDGLNTPLTTKLTPGMKVIVRRLAQHIITEQQAIDPNVQYITDQSKPVGYSQVQDPGAAGSQTLSFLVTDQDGVEQSRQLLDTKVTLQPHTKVVVIGPSTLHSGSSLADGWAKLRQCESGGNYANKRNPLYRGAYQFDYSTWGNYGGYHDPADAPPAVQDAKAQETYARRGASPWPICGRFLR